MKVIYQPKGAALEYAPLAANLYRGCTHGCRYCYAPAVLRLKPEAFWAGCGPRTNVLDDLRKDAAKLPRGSGPILLCFTSDPYQPQEEQNKITRQAIEILGEAGHKIRVLTKNGPLAVRDFDLFKKYDVEFGQTLVFDSINNRDDWAQWEPGAPPTHTRMASFSAAKACHIKCWASFEPVIEPLQTLRLLREAVDFVDIVKIGKLNHNKELESKIDWPKFLRNVFAVLESHTVKYYIKDALWIAGRGAETGRQKTNQ